MSLVFENVPGNLNRLCSFSLIVWHHSHALECVVFSKQTLQTRDKIQGKHWIKTVLGKFQTEELWCFMRRCASWPWGPHTSCSAWPLFTWKCLLLLPLVLQVQCFWLRYQHLTMLNSPMGQRFEGMPACINSGVPLQPFVSDTHHPCSATQWRTYYLPCRTSIAIVAHVNSQRTLSSFVDENILKKQYLVSDYQRRLSVLRWEMQWYSMLHTHTRL